MSERLNVKEMVVQMHEKNLVIMNILRDIAENETSCNFVPGASEEEIVRLVTDKAVRRKEILGEIFHILRQEDAARRTLASGSEMPKYCGRP